MNFLLGCVGTVQVGRILLYQRSVKGESLTEEVKDGVVEEKEVVKGMVQTGVQGVTEKAAKNV